MSELDDFRSDFLARQTEAEEALVRGDVEPRLKLWTRDNPVSLFGALGPCRYGWDDVKPNFDWIASRFAEGPGRNFRYDVEVADVVGDMAYTVGFERFDGSVPGADGETETTTVRVTHVYRREDGEWKIVHRHGDLAPEDPSPPVE